MGSNIQDLADISVEELTKGFADHTISPVEATEACLARIEMHNDTFNALWFVDAEGALKSAKESEKRWLKNRPVSPIDGVPTTTKDTTLVAGWKSTLGSSVLCSDEPATEDSSSVARLKEAGVALLGLTNSPEIGWKGVTDSPRHGITRNPWNRHLTPGGSSGGAAVAAALGMGYLHIGTDAGGSIRIPASFTGVFGHKPSFGRVPNFPPTAFSTVSHAGPITRTVKDAAYMLNIISKPDVRDWFALPYEEKDYVSLCSGDIRDLKIAFSPGMGGDTPVDAAVARQVRASVDIFRELGATVVEADFDFGNSKEIFDQFWHASVAWRLKDVTEDQFAQMDPGLLKVFEASKKYTLADYVNANQLRAQMGSAMNRFQQEYDLLLTPTLPITAFTAGRNTPDDSPFEAWFDWAAFCYPINLTRQPACSIPCGFDEDGLPIGLQIIGRQFDDATVLRAAAAFESLSPIILPEV